jgi:hypothetical protein
MGFTPTTDRAAVERFRRQSEMFYPAANHGRSQGCRERGWSYEPSSKNDDGSRAWSSRQRPASSRLRKRRSVSSETFRNAAIARFDLPARSMSSISLASCADGCHFVAAVNSHSFAAGSRVSAIKISEFVAVETIAILFLSFPRNY